MNKQHTNHWTQDKSLKKLWAPRVTHRESVNCLVCPTYSQSLKCCTYEPFIGNFVIGRHLDMFEDYLERDMSFWPLGFYPSFKIKQKLEQDPKLFGKDESLLCRFFKKGQCSIWAARGVACLNYYCRHDFGESGKLEWKNQEQAMLNFENYMTQEILAQMAYPSSLLSEQMNWQKLVELPSEELLAFYKECWQAAGYNSKKEFFLKCYQHYEDYKRGNEFEI